MTGEITGRRIVEDLEELAVAGAIDQVAVDMVRNGLAAVAQQIAALPPRASPGDWMGRREASELIDPRPPIPRDQR